MTVIFSRLQLPALRQFGHVERVISNIQPLAVTNADPTANIVLNLLIHHGSVMRLQMMHPKGDHYTNLQIWLLGANQHQDHHTLQNQGSHEFVGSGIIHSVPFRGVSISMHADIVITIHMWGTATTNLYIVQEIVINSREAYYPL